MIGGGMALKILDYPWHQVHAYRLHSIPADFYFLDLDHVAWNYAQRPAPENWRGVVEARSVQAGDFDVMLLHLDQWCGYHELDMRGMAFRAAYDVHRRTGIPAVIIMHGTPDGAENRHAVLRLIRDLPVVCNSRQAAAEWDGGEDRVDRYGLRQFRAITHGYRVSEFWSAPLTARKREIVSICSGGDTSREYHGIPLLYRIARDVPLAMYGPRGNRPWLPNYSAYRQMLARALVYFSPTRRAPMPGARTEAMLSGVCVVSVPGNDFEDHVRDGETGYIVRRYADAVRVLSGLLDEPERAYRIGRAGREWAQTEFCHKRFVANWMSVLDKIGVGKSETTE